MDNFYNVANPLRIYLPRPDTLGAGAIGADDSRHPAGACGNSANAVPQPSAVGNRRQTPLGGGHAQHHADCGDFRAGGDLGGANPNAGALYVCRSRRHRAGHQRADYVPFGQYFTRHHQAIFGGRLY